MPLYIESLILRLITCFPLMFPLIFNLRDYYSFLCILLSREHFESNNIIKLLDINVLLLVERSYISLWLHFD